MTLPADVLEDKIRGGMLGQLFGNLNGLPHEFKYGREPGNVQLYTPGLPDGARTDDDTDIEWVYVVEMQRAGELFLPPSAQVQLWRRHVNRSIWCANEYARHLMDLGIEPPVTGSLAVNPWANFNISGSFLAETFALCAPAMPQAGSRLALHYTRVAVDGEPAQSTQFTAAMICTAFVEPDVDRILDAGLAAVDPKSAIREVTADVRAWVKDEPDDWRAVRRKVRDKYTRYNGAMFDKNGVRLNTAATVAALLYGKGDFAETLRLAFNFGWDCDNNAATAGTVLGVVKGRRWMDAQGWVVKDVYRNTTRDHMPADETVTRFADRVIDLAKRNIAANGGGAATTADGKPAFRVRAQRPSNVEPLPDPLDRLPALRQALVPQIERDLAGSPTDRARAAYLAICLDEAPRLRKERPAAWADAVDALRETPVPKDLYAAPQPDGPKLQAKAKAVGVEKPAPRQ